MLFLSKDHRLAISLVRGLLRYWPFANSPKETLFVQELQEVLEVCEGSKLEPLIKPLFRRIVKCISGPHLQVADRAMCFFENDYFLGILRNYKEMTFPMLVPTICELADTHWHKVLQESLIALKTILREIDPIMFEKVNQTKADVMKKKEKETRTKQEDRWSKIYGSAQKKNTHLKQFDLHKTYKLIDE